MCVYIYVYIEREIRIYDPRRLQAGMNEWSRARDMSIGSACRRHDRPLRLITTQIPSQRVLKACSVPGAEQLQSCCP